MTPPAAATVAGRRLPRESPSPYAPRASRRATAAAAALEAGLAPSPSRPRRENPAPPRPRREAPAPGRTRREAPRHARPAQRRGRTQHAPRLALRLQPPRLDRIVRGRAWIPLLGALLVAIVGLRVEVLRLGSSVGGEIQRATTLQSSNSALRAQISALEDNRRIEQLAAGYGMHMPNPLDVHFVQASVGTHVEAAIRNITAPSNSAFLSGLAAEQQSSQQSNQAVAAMNGAGAATAAGTTAGTTGGTSNTATGTTPPASSTTAGTTGTQSTQSSAAGSTASATTYSTPAAGGTASTVGGATGSSTGASAGATTSVTGGGTAGATAGSTSNTSPPTTSVGSANGGTGLAG